MTHGRDSGFSTGFTGRVYFQLVDCAAYKPKPVLSRDGDFE
jgi:hypothetical protein